MNDTELIAALRDCLACAGTGFRLDKWPCPHCHTARMAADRIEAKNRELAALDGELKAASACEIAERVREWCAKECESLDYIEGTDVAKEFAKEIRSISIEDLLK